MRYTCDGINFLQLRSNFFVSSYHIRRIFKIFFTTHAYPEHIVCTWCTPHDRNCHMPDNDLATLGAPPSVYGVGFLSKKCYTTQTLHPAFMHCTQTSHIFFFRKFVISHRRFFPCGNHPIALQRRVINLSHKLPFDLSHIHVINHPVR